MGTFAEFDNIIKEVRRGLGDYLNQKSLEKNVLVYNGANLAYTHAQDVAKKLGLEDAVRQNLIPFPPSVTMVNISDDGSGEGQSDQSAAGPSSQPMSGGSPGVSAPAPSNGSTGPAASSTPTESTLGKVIKTTGAVIAGGASVIAGDAAIDAMKPDTASVSPPAATSTAPSLPPSQTIPATQQPATSFDPGRVGVEIR